MQIIWFIHYYLTTTISLWWFLLKKKTNKKNANMIHIISVMMNDVKGKSDMGKEDEGTTTSTIDRSAIVASLWIILR